MRHITGRTFRTVIGTAATIATLALPLVLGTAHTAPSDGARSVTASEPVDLGDLDQSTLPKPKKPGDEKGSWVWDKWD
jgi:hypothetical protein